MKIRISIEDERGSLHKLINVPDDEYMPQAELAYLMIKDAVPELIKTFLSKECEGDDN